MKYPLMSEGRIRMEKLKGLAKAHGKVHGANMLG